VVSIRGGGYALFSWSRFFFFVESASLFFLSSFFSAGGLLKAMGMVLYLQARLLASYDGCFRKDLLGRKFSWNTAF